MKLIVGLGNIGKEYESTRHNVGFMAIDEYAKRKSVSFKNEPRLKGYIAEVFINGKKNILLKPTTYMNLSGDSIKLVMDYYKIDQDDLIIISDDLSMDIGKIRLRPSGSAGGHNGLKSIISNLGNDKFHRIKVGISNNGKIDIISYVLSKFGKEDKDIIDLSINKINDIIDDFIKGMDFNKMMNKYNG